MQALKIIVPGKFYDSQIYDGRLYLWGIDNSFIAIDWNLLVGKIRIPKELKTALRFSLQYGDNLYGNLLMQDLEVRQLMQNKFQKLSELTIEVSNQDFKNSMIGQQDNPLPFPHADSAVHYKTIYAGGQSGVSASSCSVGRGRNQSIEPAKRLFDMPTLSISASHLTLAVAAGNEGLSDYSLLPNNVKKHGEPRKLSDKHCNLTRWLYPSIFGSSYFNDGYFADFKKSKRSKAAKGQLDQRVVQLVLPETSETTLIEDESKQSARQYKREFKGLISSKDIFLGSTLDENGTSEGDAAFTWGVQDKICSITGSSIKLAGYTSQSKPSQQKFSDLGSVKIDKLGGEIISADSSFFGVVIEKENGLLIISSLLESQLLEGEPVNWRVFPRSRNYTNQLHIVYEDALHIYSFNHDYFVDQSTKKLGISVASARD